jgi:hypothetical protein
MKLSVRVVLHADEGTETVVHEVFHLDRGPLTPDSLGLGLAEAKDLLAAVQSALVTEQVSAGVAAQVAGCRGFWNGIRRWRAFPQFIALFGLDEWGVNCLHSSGR